MANLLRYIGILSILCLCLQSTSPALGSSANVQVKATVLPWVKFNSQQHISLYRVTAEDIRRGYVDIPASATLNVQTNTSGTVNLACLSDTTQILIRESGAGSFQGHTLQFPLASHRSGSVSKVIDCRVILPRNIIVGTYPLSMALIPSIN